MLKRIGGLKFGILSPEQIRKMSVIEIKTPDLYDKDGFPIEGGLMDPHLGVADRGRRCKTCGQTVEKCVGHFGRLELVRPVVHVGYYKKVEFLLNISCKNCGKIMLSESELETLLKKYSDPEDLHKAIVSKVKNKQTCPFCSSEKINIKLDPPTNFYIAGKNEQGEDKNIRFYPNEIREWFIKIPSTDLEKIGLKDVRPEWFILTVLPIPPVNVHPPITLDNGLKSEDDLTFKLTDIVTVNNRLRDNINAGTPQLIIEDLWMLLQYNITTYINNNSPGVPPAKHRSGRPLKTIIQRIKGKSGIIRNNLMGKRVNFAARSIITPDMYLAIDEIGIPESVAETLTIKDKVTQYNLNDYLELLKAGDSVKYVIRPDGSRKKLTPELKEVLLQELTPGYVIVRTLIDGDITLFNRQPTLHKGSIMAHRAKIVKGNTFRMNGSVTQPYNADFDGDEMNGHIPQTPEGIMEARELLTLKKQLISSRHASPIVILMEDAIAGIFMLTHPEMKISKDLAMYYFQVAGIDNPIAPDLGDMYSGKAIFSSLLPKDFNFKFTSSEFAKLLNKIDQKSESYKIIKKESEVIIENGVLKNGAFSVSGVGKAGAKIIHAMLDKYDIDIVCDFYRKLGIICTHIITRHGLSLGLNDYVSPDGFEKIKNDKLDKFFSETKEIESKYKKGTLEKLPGKSIKESFEFYILKSGAECKDAIEKYILDNKIDILFNKKPRFSALMLSVSGAKGSITNMTNVLGLWGQVAVREKRPNRGYTGRVLSMYEKGDEGALARGFLTKNFYGGLSSREAFFHSMGGREGEVDTAVATKVSGYVYRRISNALRDISIFEDKSVRTADGKIIQFKYGDDGVNPVKTVTGELFTENRLQNILENIK